MSQTFFGVFAAAGTPKAALDKVNEVTQARWRDSGFQQRLIELGFEPMLGLGTEQAGRHLNENLPAGSLVRASGIRTQQ